MRAREALGEGAHGEVHATPLLLHARPSADRAPVEAVLVEGVALRIGVDPVPAVRSVRVGLGREMGGRREGVRVLRLHETLAEAVALGR